MFVCDWNQNVFGFRRTRPLPSVGHRFVLSAIDEPQPFGRDHALLAKFFNDWKLSGVLTIGSGRPVDARVAGDPNQDDNDSNDRIPAYGRNAFLGPDYATTDLRLTRRLYVRPHYKLELVAEAFNALNRDNKRVVITDDGFTSTATDFVQLDKTIGIRYFPAYFQKPTKPHFGKQCLCSEAGAIRIKAGLLRSSEWRGI